MSEISFGTDGWRGIIAEDYTTANLARVAEATADYLLWDGRKELDVYTKWNTPYRPADGGVIIGYDARFMSERFALTVAKVLQTRGIPTKVSDSAVPTPAVSWAVKENEAAGGIMITASHNPPEYNGFKFKCEFAASAPPMVTDEIENRLPDESPSINEDVEVNRVDFGSSYVNQLQQIVNGDLLTEAPVMAVFDSMYGSGSGIMKSVLDQFDIPVVEVRNERDPEFGGIRPEPLEENLDPLKQTVQEKSRQTDRLVVGIVTDGDGDRVSAVAENGSFVDAHRTYALLMQYLATYREWSGKAVKNFPLTDMVFKLGDKYGIDVEETPVGFKYIAEKMVREDILIGGEEAGGIGIKNHIPERDGLFCGLLLLESVAAQRKPLTEIIDDLMTNIGYHHYSRNDIELEARSEVVEQAKQNPPQSVAGFEVESVETLDGLKLRFEDGWLLWRASGTEPVLRIYCEMNERSKVKKVLEQAEAFARDLAGGSEDV